MTQAALLHTIANQVGTPFYLYDAAILRKTAALLMQTLPEVDFFYSLKANPNLSVTRLLQTSSMGCEVSSRLELETALQAGATPDRILMVGPGKSLSELAQAVDLGIKAIVAESPDEVREINTLAVRKGTVQSIALRINPDFQGSHTKLTMSGRATQFGIDQAVLPTVIKEVQSLPHIRLSGLHVYMGTRILSCQALYQNSVQCLALARSLEPLLIEPLDFVDIGGGFGIPYHEGEEDLDLASLGHALRPEISAFRTACPTTRVVVELGRYIVAPAGQFITRVRRVKCNKGKNFAICDGGSNVHSAAAGQGYLFHKNFPIDLIRLNNPTPSHPIAEWTITGPLCTPLDIIGQSVPLETPEPGDLIRIRQSGAYGLTASPVHFLGFGAPVEVMMDGQKLHVIREPSDHTRILHDQTPRLLVGSPPPV